MTLRQLPSRSVQGASRAGSGLQLRDGVTRTLTRPIVEL